MADLNGWLAPPEPLTWTIKPVLIGSTNYTTVTLRAPTSADILKATANRNEGTFAVALRLIAAVSAEEVPFEVLQHIPAYQIEQMSAYFEMFSGAPLPDPLRDYIASRNSLADPAAGSGSLTA